MRRGVLWGRRSAKRRTRHTAIQAAGYEYGSLTSHRDSAKRVAACAGFDDCVGQHLPLVEQGHVPPHSPGQPLEPRPLLAATVTVFNQVGTHARRTARRQTRPVSVKPAVSFEAERS
jgi:hypothetical protein